MIGSPLMRVQLRSRASLVFGGIMKTAIFIDGAYYRKRAARLWGKKSPEKRASELYAYCMEHMKQIRKDEGSKDRQLYRIFYYDCEPLSKVVYHPLLKKNIDFGKSETYKWTLDFFKYLKEQRKMCLRSGILLDSNASFNILPERMKELLSGKIALEDLTEEDFVPSWLQKGVDMKLGVDIASLAYKKQVDQIILIAGDTDFVPAAKIARREGIDVLLDPMWSEHITEKLSEHVDGIRSCWRKKDKATSE